MSDNGAFLIAVAIIIHAMMTTCGSSEQTTPIWTDHQACDTKCGGAGDDPVNSELEELLNT